jgi:Cof subfamily protein (haloacid dehalogenase superfamily)
MYKIIALDMDGTLLNSDHQISPRTKDVIAKARANGVNVVLSSGRPIAGIRSHLETLDILGDNDYVSHFNGAVVERVGNGEVINYRIINGAAAKKVARIAQQIGVNVHAFSQKFGLITPKVSQYTEVEANINGIDIHVMDFEQLEDDHLIYKVMMIDEPALLSDAISQLPKALYDEFMILQSAPYFLEFLNPESNKGAGIKMIAEHLKIPAEQVMCVGDAENDHHMIKFAGLGVAMGNATEATKKIADYITLTNDEDGVAYAIEKFVLNAK